MLTKLMLALIGLLTSVLIRISRIEEFNLYMKFNVDTKPPKQLKK
jgi:hypothetical protein